MKPLSAAEFIRLAREAGQDALGIASDPEALQALENVAWQQYLKERTPEALARWLALYRELFT